MTHLPTEGTEVEIPPIALVALLLAVAACSTGQSAELSRGSEANAAEGIVRLLPDASDVRPWRLTDRRLSYDASTLSDYIDGAAETYLDYGFVGVISQEYSSGAESVVCSVYEMRDPEAAFGIFSSLRSPHKQRLEVGDDAFRADAQLAFWQTHYFVTLETYTPQGSANGALETFARAISRRIGARSGLPAVMSRLPRQGLRPSTDRLLKGRTAANTLAALGADPDLPPIDAGTTVLAGDYEGVGGTYRLLVVLAGSAGGIERVRRLPGQLFTRSAGYLPVAPERGTDVTVWTRRGRAFAAQPIDGGVRLVIDAARLEEARAAIANATQR